MMNIYFGFFNNMNKHATLRHKMTYDDLRKRFSDESWPDTWAQGYCSHFLPCSLCSEYMLCIKVYWFVNIMTKTYVVLNYSCNCRLINFCYRPVWNAFQFVYHIMTITKNCSHNAGSIFLFTKLLVCFIFKFFCRNKCD